MRYFLGIVGGMGPEATEILQKHIRHTAIARANVQTDQEHMPIASLINTHIPDRTAALLQLKTSPVPELLQTTRELLNLDIQHVVYACNTAHAFLPAITEALNITERAKIINMVAETVRICPPYGTALLATNGTLQSGLYTGYFSKAEKHLLTLETSNHQQAVHDVIYHYIKAGQALKAVPVLLQAVQRLQQQGATHIILGCTELPIAYAADLHAFNRLGVTYIDPMQVLANRAVDLWQQYKQRQALTA